MRKIVWFFLFLFVSMVISLSAFSIQEDLYGTWEKEGNRLVINEDQTYEVYFSGNQAPNAYGNYTVEEDIITLVDEGGSHACDALGKYSFDRRDNMLQFEVSLDLCFGRTTILRGDWSLINE